MACTVVPVLTLIHDCDSLADWTGSPTLDTEVYIQGSGSLSAKVSKTTSTFYKPITAVDLSDTIIYIWAMCGTAALLDTKAGGGVRIYVTDGTYFGEWYVGGKDTWAGGWECFAIRTTQAFDNSNGTVDKTAITGVGITWKVTASVAKINCWWDVLRHGTGLRVKGGTEAEPATWEDIYSVDNATANKYGVLIKYEGVYMLQGKLWIGSTTAGEATYFKDTGKIIVFRDKAFGVFYEITIKGNATATTKVFFGTKVGGRGISGCIFQPAGASKYKITATDTNITELGFYGCTFMDADTISLPAYAVGKEVLSCSFEACAEVLADTCIVQYCNFVNADDRGVRIASTPHYITYSNFIGCGHGVNITIDGTVTVTFEGLKFSGNTYDVEKSSPTGDLTIQNTEDSDTSTYEITGGGTVTIETAVTLTVRHVKTGNEPTEYVRCSIHKKSDMSEIMNMDATVADDLNPGYYKASKSHNQSGFAVIVKAREKGWLPFEIETTITSDGLDVTAVWLEDPNYQA